MLGSQVYSDLGLAEISTAVPTHLPWGTAAFTKGLTDLSADPQILKRRQLPILALKTNHALLESATDSLKSLAPYTESIDSILQHEKENDQLRTESIGQILWSKDSPGAFLNTKASVINGLMTWKTLILPGFAILTPLLGLIIPYFVLRYLQPSLLVSDYLEQVKTTLLKQITIPSFARARSDNDVVGFVLQSCFIGLTLVMFISGLWNQVSTALYLRGVWRSLQESGASFKALVNTANRLHRLFISAPQKQKAALHALATEGRELITVCEAFGSAADISAFGAVWNNGMPLLALREWIGRVDVYVALAKIQQICLPKYHNSKTNCPQVKLRSVIHPHVHACIPNNYDSSAPNGHVVLTGPNRGGKSTFCKSVGLAIITAQSWGFVWAASAYLTPFAGIHTALETQGKLGHASTFEAEIAFAKTVLADTKTPVFVMMDEIFTSTNAVDGVEASHAFLTKLYSKQGVISLISTHYRELTKLFESQASLYRLACSTDEGGSLAYTYRVEDGVSDKSSVSEILKEHGLL